jgi:hypothetical protein
MVTRIIGVSVGLTVFFLVLYLRGLPVLFFLKMFPLILLLLIAAAFIYAGVTND